MSHNLWDRTVVTEMSYFQADTRNLCTTEKLKNCCLRCTHGLTMQCLLNYIENISERTATALPVAAVCHNNITVLKNSSHRRRLLSNIRRLVKLYTLHAAYTTMSYSVEVLLLQTAKVRMHKSLAPRCKNVAVKPRSSLLAFFFMPLSRELIFRKIYNFSMFW